MTFAKLDCLFIAKQYAIRREGVAPPNILKATSVLQLHKTIFVTEIPVVFACMLTIVCNTFIIQNFSLFGNKNARYPKSTPTSIFFTNIVAHLWKLSTTLLCKFFIYKYIVFGCHVQQNSVDGVSWLKCTQLPRCFPIWNNDIDIAIWKCYTITKYLLCQQGG